MSHFKWSFYFITLTFRVLALAILSPVFVSATYAADIGGGLAAVNDGDDRQRPAAEFHFGTSGGIESRGYLYGRKFGPVQERFLIVAVTQRFSLIGDFLMGSVGPSICAEDTRLTYGDYPDSNGHFTSTNFGIAMGLHAKIISLGPVSLRLAWDSHVYPAGQAFIFLANARKQALGVLANVQF